MKAGVLFSGGKDSTLALHLSKEFGLEITCLISIIPSSRESYMFHYPNISLVDLQSKAMGIPLIKIKTKGEKEKELDDLKEILIRAKDRFGIKSIITGAVRSTYQSSRIQRVANELSLEVFNPLWLKEDIIPSLLRKYNIKAIITGVYAYPLGEDLLGKDFMDEYESLEEYKSNYGVSVVGEGGELETFVIDAPLFKKRIDIISAEIYYHNYQGTYVIREAKLVNKYDGDH